MAVPTNDWKQVKYHHLENSIFRAVENQYGIVRAASDGISVIVSSHGKILARKDHFKEGPGIIVADLPIYRQSGIYSFLGDLLPILLSLILLVIGFICNKSRLCT